MANQWQRQIMLIGDAAQDKLLRSHAAVFGVGGVGSFVCEALARAGVGTITLIDNDTVSESNLNRQLVALHSTLGKYKTEVMAKRIFDINPNCRVIERREFFCEENAESFFDEKYDYIADAIDSVPSKVCLIKTALERDLPIISSMGTGNRLDPTQLQITDLSKTSGCPLARVMRQKLRALGIQHLTVLSSTELPVKPIKDETLDENVPGSCAWVPPCAGMMIAGFIVRKLLEDNA